MLHAKLSAPVWRGVIVGMLVLLLPLLSACGGRPSAPPTSRQTGLSEESGATLFARHCAACHGAQAEGRPNVGPGLLGNAFVDGLSDDELLEFLIVGRPINDPANRTGIPMPPRGAGNLGDDQLAAVITWLRNQVH